MSDRGRTVIAAAAVALALWAIPAQGAVSVGNTAPIAIPAGGSAASYPATIEVNGLTGRVVEAHAALMAITHPRAEELEVLLVGPGGRATILMRGACGSEEFVGKVLFFAEIAPGPLTEGSCVTGHGYKPTDLRPESGALPPPAPPGPYQARMSAFDGISPNGQWRLYVADRASSGAGIIEHGWRLSIETRTSGCGPSGAAPCPRTRITRGPKRRTTSRRPVFRFRSNLPGASFQCKLDRGKFRPCRSPHRLRRLKLGRHTFRVRARGRGGALDPAPAKRTFRVIRRG